MARKTGNYLRVRRRQWALTQKELAFLFGYRSETIITRLERRECGVTLAVAFACQLIFGVEPQDIFPVLFDQVEEGMVRRMYELYSRLKESKSSKKTAAKLQLLQGALARATKGATPHEI